MTLPGTVGFDLTIAGQHVEPLVRGFDRAFQRHTSPTCAASILSRATWPLPISARTALAYASARANRV